MYHPNSNPAERVLREVGRLLRTYCHDQQKKWQEYLASTEEFLKLAYHNTIEDMPYSVMFEKPPPREINDIINFPNNPTYQFERAKFYNRILEKTELQKKKYLKNQPKAIKYHIGEKVVVRNRELPSTVQGITKKLLVLYTGPYLITKDNDNNTYEFTNPVNNKIKGTYNQVSLRKYHEQSN